MSRLNMAIPDRHAPSVLQECSPSVGRSTADYGEHAVDVRIRGRQSSREIHLDENPRFYEGFRALLLAWVSYRSQCESTLLQRLKAAVIVKAWSCSVSGLRSQLGREYSGARRFPKIGYRLGKLNDDVNPYPSGWTLREPLYIFPLSGSLRL